MSHIKTADKHKLCKLWSELQTQGDYVTHINRWLSIIYSSIWRPNITSNCYLKPSLHSVHNYIQFSQSKNEKSRKSDLENHFNVFHKKSSELFKWSKYLPQHPCNYCNWENRRLTDLLIDLIIGQVLQCQSYWRTGWNVQSLFLGTVCRQAHHTFSYAHARSHLVLELDL